MFKNYLKITFRNLLKHKIYSLINILGLTIGLTCSMLILIYVLHEFSFDRFHKNGDRIFRLGREVSSAEGETREPLSSSPTAQMLVQDYPEVEAAVRFRGTGKSVVCFEDNQFYEKRIYYVDENVFDVFTFPMISGDPQTALKEPFAVVITREMAEKYFGQQNPMGKVLKFNNQHDYWVTGVIENIPQNSHLEINMLCSYNTLNALNDPTVTDWFAFYNFTYLLLKENFDSKQLEQKFPTFIERYIGKDAKQVDSSLSFYLLPLNKLYLFSHLDGSSPGRITGIVYYCLMALFIVLIACINFMNLSTARATTRAKEVGLRKVIGAGKTSLVIQFLSEATILSFVALLISIFLVELLLTPFSNIIGQKLAANYLDSPGLIPGFLGLALGIGLISGSYPAFYLSRFQPIHVLKGSLKSGRVKSKIRSTLVVVQFISASILICQTQLTMHQLSYLKNKEPGFFKKNIVVLSVTEDKIRQSLKTLKKELVKLPEVINVTSASSLPGLGIPRNVKIPEGFTRNQVQLMDDINVDHDFIPTLGIEIIAGRNFLENHPADQQQAVIINETAALKYNWKNPIGKEIQFSVGPDKYQKGVVIGMVKDFHLSSLHRVIEPLFISNRPENLNHILIRIQPDDASATLQLIQEQWQAVNPGYPFEYTFLEESYDHYFRVVERVFQVMYYFAILAIFLAAMGIFALAAFTAEQRTKEIGIRKVLGDTTFGIVLRLNKELLRLVFIAAIIVFPYLYFTRNGMSTFFPYVADFSPWLFIKSALIIILTAIATVSYQSIKSALANPVDSIRYE